MSSGSTNPGAPHGSAAAPLVARGPTGPGAEVTRNQRYFQALFENASDAFVVLGAHGQFLDANPAACELIGLTRDELIGRSVTENIETSTDFSAAWGKFLREQTYRGQRWLVRPDGTRRLIEIRATAHVLPGHHLAIWRDVTSRYFLESELVQRERNEALIRLAGGIAHDLTNLLHVIGGNAELIARRPTPNSELQGHIDRILASTKQAGELTAQLSALGRQQVISPSVLDLSAFVQTYHGILRRLLREDVDLVLLQNGVSAPIRIDRTQMVQILITLVSAAGERMPNSGRITIGVRNVNLPSSLAKPGVRVPAGSYVVLEVETGPIDASRPHDSKPSRFLSPVPGRERAATLPAVSATLKQNDAVLWVDNESTPETNFCVYFPQMASSPLTTPGEQSGASLGGSETILLVEDDPGIREAAREYLKCLGYRVLRAGNGEDALRVAQSEARVDALIADLRMPKMGGEELAERLSTALPALKVMFISGDVDRGLVNSEARPREAALLAEPFAMRALASTLRDLLDGRAADPA
jgi:two-component system, cell cycle sensor histidine kinase and response regulator CckA